MKRFAVTLLTTCTLLLLGFQLDAQSSGKKILLEKITSAGCPGCPNGGLILEGIAQNDPNVIPVAIHLNDQWHVDQMANADGDSILAAYWWAQPTLMIDRVKFSDQTRMAILSPFWQDKINARKLEPMQASLGAISSYDPNSRSLSVEVMGNMISSVSGEVRVNAYVVESPVSGTGLGYDQLNGYNSNVGHPLYNLGDPIIGYEHKWVLRDMLGGPWGEAGVLPNPAPAGSYFSHTFTTQLDSGWNALNCYLVVLVQHFDPNDDEKRSVINAMQIELNDNVPTYLEEPNASSSLRIVPHPLTERSLVENPFPEAKALHIYDVGGRLVRKMDVAGMEWIAVEKRELEPGLYFLELNADGIRLTMDKLLVH